MPTITTEMITSVRRSIVKKNSKYFPLILAIYVFISALLVMTLGMHFMTNRTSILIGGIFKTAAIITAALSKDVAVLFFSIGILEGRRKYTSLNMYCPASQE